MTKDNEFTIPATKYSDDEEERLAWLAGGQSGQFKIAEVIYVDRTVKRLTKTVANMPPKEVQAIVGGYIEHIRINATRSWRAHNVSHEFIGVARNHALNFFKRRRFVSMWVNEDGVGLGLPFNPKASELAGIPIRGNVIAESWLSRS